MTIKEKLIQGSDSLTKADKLIVQELLANYPTSGLSTVSDLAARSRVSDPSVVRFVRRLGFDSYPAFQKALLAEVDERMNSPLSMFDKANRSTSNDSFGQYLDGCADLLRRAGELNPPGEYERMVTALADPDCRVSVLGGRYSRYLAGYLNQHLGMLRADTRTIDPIAPEEPHMLEAFGRRDLLVVFDYRRYQADVIRTAELVRKRGARICLFTDPWRSPIARIADASLLAPVESLSPFDSTLVGMAQLEAVVAGLTARLGAAAEARMQALEELAGDLRAGKERDGDG
ncbi:MurR/RpiR family transcriptional regulator [Sphingomonas colocasiae]|uniref:MurR/RpiR family transcriptional regulator n=1 Tax=Sphingomonas colocasiae TaxID=1848973 RepID=A0ABS7PYD6_9SPHN|nr:MurR/RpiR family transcriptional regulator [Sphingomonas colocasiae]MBY8825347.1 MurR/RpiR family transcriptional regulator [Sphingomonas colocasiae]